MKDLNTIKNEVESIINTYLPKEEGYAKKVIEAMNYAFSAGGKRIRPVLMYLVYKAYGAKGAEVEPFMAAIEMIHTYSLIHDDLPALDNDDLRRGRPTCHVQFGEDIAILAGDGLLNYAYETAAKAFAIKPGTVAVEKAYTILAIRPGISGMIGGQTADVCLTGSKLNQEELIYIYENKTSALIECAMTIGAVLAGASEEEAEKIRQAAHAVGMAFQVQDDVLDMIGDEATLGKPIGSDEKNEKYTYASIFGLEQAKKYVKEQTAEAIRLLDEVSFSKKEETELLKGLLVSLIDRNK